MSSTLICYAEHGKKLSLCRLGVTSKIERLEMLSELPLIESDYK